MNKKNICTIEEWSVNWNELGNSLLCTHEYMHETLTITTIYGTIQRQIKFYSDHFPSDLSLKRIQYELFKHVMFIQECCATFCSVMQVTNNIEKGEHLLPTSYLIYYSKYYNCIKSNIKSTHFAFIFAETIAQSCMNNQVHIQIINYLKTKSTTFSPLPFSPDICFDSIISNLTSNTLEEIIDYCNSQNPDPFSDINNDHYWKHQNLDKINQLNGIVFNAIYNYLSQNFVNLNILSLDTIHANSYSWINSLNDALIAKYGDVGFSYTENHVHPYKLDDHMLLALECLDTVKIYNQPYMRSDKCLPSDDTLGINYRPYHNKLTLHTFLCENCFFDTSGNWYQFNSDGTFSDDAYFHYKRLSDFICQNPLFVISMIAEGKTKDFITNEINIIYENLKTICKDSKARVKSFSRYNTMFYMFGKFSYWLDYLVQYPACKFHILVIDDKNISNTQKENTFAMVALYSSSLPGVFIKCFNTISYSKTLQLLDTLTKQNMTIPDYSKERLIIAEKMKQSFHAIDSLWLEF